MKKMKTVKRIIAFLAAGAMALSLSVPAFAETSASQIKSASGGSSTTDGVTYSKTIEGTSLENVFDITLQVKTTENLQTLYQDPDVAVCIVMDISNTMLEDYGTSTKYAAALAAAQNFVDLFANYTEGAQSKLGFVAFNTDGQDIMAMQRCDTTARATTFKSNMKKGTDAIIKKYKDQANYDASYHTNKRWTNIEAGLKLAKDKLAACPNQNKFVVFLSDGLPTTYCKTTDQNDKKYTGWGAPMSESGTQNTEGVFRDKISGIYCKYATNYSNKGAIRGRQMATALKNSGVKVFTIGAGLNSFEGTKITEVTAWNTDDKAKNLSGEAMIRNQMARAFYKGVATVDNNFAKISSYNSTTINNYQWEIANFKGGTSGQYASLGTSGLFENWLTYGIGSGSGYYYPTSNATQIQNKFKDIFSNLQSHVQENAKKAWVVTDPMGTNLEFIGFYNKSGKLASSLTGSFGSGKENTASISGSTFTWQLQKSGYETSGSTYIYTLKYRVRLKNEAASGFAEGTFYNTNGTTTLTYQVMTNGVISAMKTVNFKVPAVKGYISELVFTKKDQFGAVVADAAFKLEHDTTSCSICKGNGSSVAISGNLAAKTATSGADGKVSFSEIPSGHKYKLTETTVPSGYLNNGSTYTVTVAYDVVTVTEKKSDGTTTTWNSGISSVVENPLRTFKIQIKKKDGTNQTEKVLEGAKFQLFTDAAMTTLANHPKRPGDPDEAAVIGATETINGKTYNGVLTSDKNGMINIGELSCNKKDPDNKPTYYYMKEIQAPTGYDLLTDPVVIHLDPDTGKVSYKQTNQNAGEFVTVNATTTQADGTFYVLTVTNTSGYELPSTGGPGTAAFYIIGSLLVTGAGLILVAGRRMSVL